VSLRQTRAGSASGADVDSRPTELLIKRCNADNSIRSPIVVRYERRVVGPKRTSHLVHTTVGGPVARGARPGDARGSHAGNDVSASCRPQRRGAASCPRSQHTLGLCLAARCSRVLWRTARELLASGRGPCNVRRLRRLLARSSYVEGRGACRRGWLVARLTPEQWFSGGPTARTTVLKPFYRSETVSRARRTLALQHLDEDAHKVRIKLSASVH
jgi:hypothetical protein